MKNLERLKIVIVGSELKKWNKEKEKIAREVIIKIMTELYPDALFLSGECPYGGVDSWVKETAENLNKAYKGYPPKKNKWYYYKKRNMQMAQDGDVIITIDPDGLSSGGTWTVEYAKTLGKLTFVVEI